MNTIFVLWVLFVHWVADFVCQNDRMAVNKSHDWAALFAHSLVYFVVLVVGLHLYSLTPVLLSPWVILNFPAHFIIDGITSRINTKLYQASERHWFFVMVGFDQVLHYVVLFLTLNI